MSGVGSGAKIDERRVGRPTDDVGEPHRAGAGPDPASTSDTTSASASGPDPAEPDDAVDDSEDLPDDFVSVQKTISDGRRRAGSGDRLQDSLPFRFSPNLRPLTLSDLDSCVALEDAAFTDPAHRASREKFEYRLATCPELSLGVFCTVEDPAAAAAMWGTSFGLAALDAAGPVQTGRAAVSVLLAHAVATRCAGPAVADSDMDYPRGFRRKKKGGGGGGGGSNAMEEEEEEEEEGDDDDDDGSKGHQPTGRTLALHSLAVDPRLHGRGLGKLLVKAYLQQVKNAALADRVSLICQEYLVNYYKRFGFTHLGPSAASFAGGGWHDMSFELGAAKLS
ncbi:acyl-CoA N-acyltransferase [Xylariomycetidae sp. FL0641]|nr:acyl-CoA N-acyltransferase [Xylariomycetidae sp. FL0641]